MLLQHGLRVIPLLITLLAFLALEAAYSHLLASQLMLPAGSSVLYAAGFDGFADEWEQYEGRLSAQIDEGVLRISVNNVGSTAYTATSMSFQDFDLTVTAQAVEGAEDNGFGVLFRLQKPSPPACDMPLHILCDIERLGGVFSVPLRLLFRPQPPAASGYYMFLISSDGYYSLWKAQTDASGTTSARRISTWIASEHVRTGLNAPNTLRVIAQGTQFTFYINGHPAALCIPDDPTSESTYYLGECLQGSMRTTWTDNAFQQGQIGLVAQSTTSGGAGVVILFDNLVITTPKTSGGDA